MQLAASRSLKPDELELLTRLHENHLSTYKQDEEAANQLIQTGESPILSKAPAAELASLTMICNLILNLDEVMTLN